MPESLIVRFRLHPLDAAALDEMCESTGKTRSDVIRDALVVHCGTATVGKSVGGGGGKSLTTPKKNRSLVPASSTKKEKPSHCATVSVPQPTWLSPYLSAWLARYGGLVRPGMLARYLAPLEKEHGPEKTLKHFRNFLAATDAKYVRVSRFAETFGSWNLVRTNGKDLPDIEPGETNDQYAARLAVM